MRTQNLQVAAGAASMRLSSAAGKIYNIGCRETTGLAGAVFRLTDGNQPNADLLMPYSLAANESARDNFGEHGIPVQDGIYFELISGSVEVNVNMGIQADIDRHCSRVMVIEPTPRMGP